MTDSLNDIWIKVLSHIKKDLNNGVGFRTWFKSCCLIMIHDDIAVIETPNDFVKNNLETRYTDYLKNAFYKVLNKSIQIQFLVFKQDIDEDVPEINFNDTNDTSSINFLNPKYTFETFVIGNGNRLAHAASLAVAESPAKAYNPLFIYGGVGLGKTHLMHAIGHYILNKYKTLKVLYVSSEKFTNELINSIRDDKNTEFRNRYRNIDVLLVDDIQFIAKKERTQEEFFHTFNALHEANKQIIISSDRPPKDIPTLEDRLRSRFEWGLISDIQPPDFETRIAILRKKAELENIEIPCDVMAFIADKINTNIRELEGALIRIMAYSSLTNTDVNVEIAEEVLKDIISDNRPRQITLSLIQETVSSYYNLKVDEFKSKKRTRAISFPRQVAMYLCRKLTDASLPKIGEEFGGRDHTTVIHAYDRISSEIKTDPSLQKTIDELISIIKGSN